MIERAKNRKQNVNNCKHVFVISHELDPHLTLLCLMTYSKVFNADEEISSSGNDNQSLTTFVVHIRRNIQERANVQGAVAERRQSS
jgi:hypothetical protein